MLNIKLNNKHTCLATSKSKSLKVARRGRMKMIVYTYWRTKIKNYSRSSQKLRKSEDNDFFFPTKVVKIKQKTKKLSTQNSICRKSICHNEGNIEITININKLKAKPKINTVTYFYLECNKHSKKCLCFWSEVKKTKRLFSIKFKCSNESLSFPKHPS